MDIQNKIEEDLKNALKNKDEKIVSTLRLLKSSLKNKEIEKKESLKEDEVLELILKEIKKRKESADIYLKAGRKELADKESDEAEILTKYVPEQMNEDELISLIKEAISKTGAESMKDMGKVMAHLMPNLKGRADGSLVSKKVSELLE